MEHNGKEKRGETGFRLLAQVWQFSLEPKERHEQARGLEVFIVPLQLCLTLSQKCYDVGG